MTAHVYGVLRDVLKHTHPAVLKPEQTSNSSNTFSLQWKHFRKILSSNFFGGIVQVCSHSVYSQELLRCMLDIARVEFQSQIHLSVYDEPISFFLLILILCWCIFDRNTILFYHSWSLFHKFLILFYFRIYDTYRNIHSVWITSQHRHQIQKEEEITGTHL